MSDSLLDALKLLDPEKDEHWTQDGLPRLDVVKELTGADVQRKELSELAPNFSRSNPVLVQTDGDNGGDSQGTPWGTNDPSPDSEGGEDGTPPEDNGDQEGAGDQDDKDGTDQQPQDDGELTEKEAALKEHKEARESLNKAQSRMRKAEEALDAIIAKEEAESAGVTTMQDIQAYQRSQQEQRRRMVEGR